jgi:Fe-S-cluster-containing hydrogenase component 2
MCRLLTRLYDRAEQHADSIQDSHSLAAVLAQAGAMPPALLAALEAALAAEDLDGQFQVRQHSCMHLYTCAQAVPCGTVSIDAEDVDVCWCLGTHDKLCVLVCAGVLLQASMLELPSVMELVSLLDEPDPELLWMVRGSSAGCWQSA